VEHRDRFLSITGRHGGGVTVAYRPFHTSPIA
jgi:hypothetical protein